MLAKMQIYIENTGMKSIAIGASRGMTFAGPFKLHKHSFIINITIFYIVYILYYLYIEISFMHIIISLSLSLSLSLSRSLFLSLENIYLFIKN